MSSALTRALRVLADCLGSSTFGRGAAAAVKAVPPSSRGARFSGRSYRNDRPSRNSRANAISRAAVAALFEPLEERAMMSATYYVSPTGNDSNSGTISAPWKSIGKVSGTHLNPGDKVLFQGGSTFSGSLNLYNDGGSATNPVTISSYGSGRAIISSGGSNGVWSLNSTGMTISNLKFVGTPSNNPNHQGVRIENYSSNTTRSGFIVTNCDVSGYGTGIGFGTDSSSEYLNNVSITNNTVYNCEETGIGSWTVNNEGLTNIYVGYNTVHNIFGDGTSTVTGDGIELQGLNGALVEYNSSYDNGIIGGSGNVGIWCYSSNKVVFQYNESYGNQSRSWDDGDGFDFDSDTSNSIMQYNFAADNYGGGFQLNQWVNDNTGTGNIIRYNISQDNGLKGNYAGIDVWGKIENAQIYNNVVYTSTPISGTTQGLRISNNTITSLKPSNIKIVGNIFVSANGVDLVNGYTAAIDGSSGIQFEGNVYYALGAFNIVYAGVDYHTLASWQSATGQEKLNGQAVGLSTNPMLKAVGQGVPTTSATDLASITAYTLLSGSPVLTSSFAATAAKALGITSVSTDFFGNAVPSAIIAGVAENGSKATATTTTGSTTTSTGSTGSTTSTTSTGSTTSSGSTTTTSTTTSTGSTTSSNSSSGSTTSTGSTTTSSSNSSTGTTTTALKLTGTNVGSITGGASSGSGTSYTVSGGGTDIWGTSDNMRYDYTTLTGDGTIIAEVNSQADTSSYAKSGIMIRNGSSVSSNSAEVSLLLEPDKKAEFQTRASAGASTSTKEMTNVTYKWVKLVRSGNTFTGYISSNGTSWTLVGSSTVSMSSTVTIGLAVTAHDPTRVNTASFSNVAVS
jgi:hypothetical protein